MFGLFSFLEMLRFVRFSCVFYFFCFAFLSPLAWQSAGHRRWGGGLAAGHEVLQDKVPLLSGCFSWEAGAWLWVNNCCKDMEGPSILIFIVPYFCFFVAIRGGGVFHPQPSGPGVFHPQPYGCGLNPKVIVPVWGLLPRYFSKMLFGCSLGYRSFHPWPYELVLKGKQTPNSLWKPWKKTWTT